MPMQPVESSNLQGYDYDEGSKVLTVYFHGGRGYQYKDVEPDVVRDLEGASSKGRFFNERIKGKYAYI